MTEIQNTSYSFATPKYLRVAVREHTLAPPGRHRPRHSRMSLSGSRAAPERSRERQGARGSPGAASPRAAGASCLYAGSAPSVTNAIGGGDGRLADGRRRSKSTRKRSSHPAPPERVVQVLQERPRVVHVRAAEHDLDAAAGIELGDLLVGRAPRDVDDDLKCDVLLDTRTGRGKTHTHSINRQSFTRTCRARRPSCRGRRR